MEYQPVYDRPAQAARSGECVYYSELAKLVGFDTGDLNSAARRSLRELALRGLP